MMKIKKSYNLIIKLLVLLLFFSFINTIISYSQQTDELRIPSIFLNKENRQYFERIFGVVPQTSDQIIVFMVALEVIKIKQRDAPIEEIKKIIGPSFQDYLDQSLLITQKDGIIYIAYKDSYLAINDTGIIEANSDQFERTHEITRIVPTQLRDEYFPVAALRDKNNQFFRAGADWAIVRYGPLEGKEILVRRNVFNPQFGRATRFLSEVLIRYKLVKKGDAVLDVGGGTGIQAITALENGASTALCLDVNPMAVENIKRNADYLKLKERLAARESNLFDALRDNEKFDLIIFNPPFIAGKPVELWDKSVYDENYAIIRGFFSKVSRYLNPDGRIVIIFSTKSEEDGYYNLFQYLTKANGLIARSVDSIIRNHDETYTVYEIKISKELIDNLTPASFAYENAIREGL